MTWAGYPVSIDGNLSLFWSTTLNRAKARLEAAANRRVPPRAPAIYANSYFTSRVIHLLSFDIPPVTFVDAFEHALISFVWHNNSFRPVIKAAVFLRRHLAELGLLSIEDIVCSMAIRFWDCVAHGFEPIWGTLARIRWERTYPEETPIWSTLIASHRRATHARWTKVINVGRLMLTHVFPELLWATEVLVIPPTLPSLLPQGLSDDAHKRLKKFGAIIDLYRRPTGDPVNPGLQPESLLEKLWANVSASSPIASALPQPAAVRTAIGDCYFLRPCTYKFLGATRPFTIKALRHFINEARYPSLEDGSRLKWPTDLTKSQKRQFWIWLNSQWATAVEKDVDWKLIFGATPTCVLQHHHGHAASDGCPQCRQRDTFMHFYFECDHSRQFWRLTLQLLSVALGQADDFQPGKVDSPRILLGLPRVCDKICDSRTYIVIWVVLAISFNMLQLA